MIEKNFLGKGRAGKRRFISQIDIHINFLKSVEQLIVTGVIKKIISGTDRATDQRHNDITKKREKKKRKPSEVLEKPKLIG